MSRSKKMAEDRREAEKQARLDHERREAVILAKLKSDKNTWHEQSNNNKDIYIHKEAANKELPSQKFVLKVSMTESDLKAPLSETNDISKVDVMILTAIEKGVNECTAYPTRMKIKLLLQQHNVTVDKLTVAGKDISVWNDNTNATKYSILLRNIENDKIQSSLSVASIAVDKKQGSSNM